MFKVHRTFSLSTGIKGPSIAVVSTATKVTVVYHQTAVVVANRTPRGWVVTLDSGGYDTVSTRAVINRAMDQLGCSSHLFRHKGRTLLQLPDGKQLPFNGSAVVRSMAPIK